MYQSPTPPSILFRLQEYIIHQQVCKSNMILPPCLEPKYEPWRRPEGQAVSLLYNAKRELPGRPGPAPHDACRRGPALMSDERPKKALKSRALLQFLSAADAIAEAGRRKRY
jgi:hypothetical protein